MVAFSELTTQHAARYRRIPAEFAREGRTCLVHEGATGIGMSDQIRPWQFGVSLLCVFAAERVKTIHCFLLFK